ncbi:MAG: hypothetical protein HY286_01780 [Planctomycetes bacterium]|nr:hypothetical protein [Planctomycetota bacterium]
MPAQARPHRASRDRLLVILATCHERFAGKRGRVQFVQLTEKLDPSPFRAESLNCCKTFMNIRALAFVAILFALIGGWFLFTFQSRSKTLKSDDSIVVAPEPDASTKPSSGPQMLDMKLPTLIFHAAKPIFESDQFEDEDEDEGEGTFRYPKVRQIPPKPPSEPPYATDDEAVEGAKNWIIQHFGPLPPNVNYVAKSVQHSSSGQDKPQFDWDRGHTIRLQLTYKDIPMDEASILYITGKTQFDGYVTFGTFEEKSGSAKPIITKEAAVDSAALFLEFKGVGARDIEEFKKSAKWRLEYHLRRSSYRPGSKVKLTYIPAWVIEEPETMVVNAYNASVQMEH